jgi:hypothetical protein
MPNISFLSKEDPVPFSMLREWRDANGGSPREMSRKSEYAIRRRTMLFVPLPGWCRFVRNFSFVWLSFEGRPGPSGHIDR